MPKKLTIQEMSALAIARGGRCLSKEYVNDHAKLQWRCHVGHFWMATPNNVKFGVWCPRCACRATGDRLRGSIGEMIRIAQDRGGKCVSKIYLNSFSALRWTCSAGHIWNMNPASVKIGQWCPLCSSGKAERICRVYLEYLFGSGFPKIRPSWLRNSRDNQMELDGYSEKFKLAFEHHGEQHYRLTIFIKNKKALKQRQLDDIRKIRLCKLNGIKLIVIPCIPSRLKVEDLMEFIYKWCANNSVQIPTMDRPKKINLKSVFDPGALNNLKFLAAQHGGQCLSKIYLGSKQKHIWRCKCGHIWDAPPEGIKRGQWCPKCGKERCLAARRLTIEEMQNIAKRRGGLCLSIKYVNCNIKLLWECSIGHRWSARAYSVKAGHWCPFCGGRRKWLHGRQSAK